MKMKRLRTICFLAIMAAAVWLGGLLADAGTLRRDILRLHVVAASDSRADQEVKLRVRDVVLDTLSQGLADVADPDQAVEYVRSMLPQLTRVCNEALEQAGFSDTVKITLGEEAFPQREYDTFRLPSGVYQALRVVIGPGQGHNWWCVVFPSLCTGATQEEFVATAQTRGMEPSLTGALTGEYELRFWLLDQLGRLENFFRRDSE